MKIFIVDDNEQITQLLSKILAAKGHNVVTVNIFEKCLDMLEKENFDVVIVDAPMPRYDQLNTIYELDKKGILQSHKIILFSGLKISNQTIMDLKRKGLYSYLPKPLEVEKFLQELLSIPSVQNTELTEKRISEEQTKKKLQELRSNLSSLKLKLHQT